LLEGKAANKKQAKSSMIEERLSSKEK